MTKSEVVKGRIDQAIAKAEAAVKAAQEKLDKAKERLAKLRAEAPHQIRLAKLKEEAEKERAALRELRGPATVKADAGASPTKELTPKQVKVVRSTIGRRSKGVLKPLEGKEAQAVLTALDEGGNVGDSFTVTLPGRKPVRVHFEVTADGLAFNKLPS